MLLGGVYSVGASLLRYGRQSIGGHERVRSMPKRCLAVYPRRIRTLLMFQFVCLWSGVFIVWLETCWLTKQWNTNVDSKNNCIPARSWSFLNLRQIESRSIVSSKLSSFLLSSRWHVILLVRGISMLHKLLRWYVRNGGVASGISTSSFIH